MCKTVKYPSISMFNGQISFRRRSVLTDLLTYKTAEEGVAVEGDSERSNSVPESSANLVKTPAGKSFESCSNSPTTCFLRAAVDNCIGEILSAESGCRESLSTSLEWAVQAYARLFCGGIQLGMATHDDRGRRRFRGSPQRRLRLRCRVRLMRFRWGLCRADTPCWRDMRRRCELRHSIHPARPARR